MNIVKRWIGKLTRPQGLKKDSFGQYWRRCHGVPDFDMDTKSYFMDYSHPYQYQAWSQNWIGKWVEESHWIWLNSPMKSR